MVATAEFANGEDDDPVTKNKVEDDEVASADASGIGAEVKTR